LIEAHGGTILVRAPDGGGTIFEIHLPITLDDVVPVADLDRETGDDPTGIILVVEDETDVGRMTSEILTQSGHLVTVANSGADALRLMADTSYDLVISDFRMPEMDGRALFHEVKTRYPWMAKQFVFVTGASLSADAREFLIDSKRPVIEKPFTPDDLRRFVSENLDLVALPGRSLGQSDSV
jgi:two-component system NtrC family sensor kinase